MEGDDEDEDAENIEDDNESAYDREDDEEMEEVLKI